MRRKKSEYLEQLETEIIVLQNLITTSLIYVTHYPPDRTCSDNILLMSRQIREVKSCMDLYRNELALDEKQKSRKVNTSLRVV